MSKGAMKSLVKQILMLEKLQNQAINDCEYEVAMQAHQAILNMLEMLDKCPTIGKGEKKNETI